MRSELPGLIVRIALIWFIVSAILGPIVGRWLESRDPGRDDE